MTPPKIDKSHGFMQSIIKNQVLRDEYDQEQRLLATEKRSSLSLKNERLSGPAKVEMKRTRTPKREAKQLYVPPHMKKRVSEDNADQSEPKEKGDSAKEVGKELKRSRRSTSHKDVKSKVLFKFEYEGDEGEVRTLLVREDDNAEDLAETFGNQLGLTKSLKKALQHRLEQEIRSCLNS